MLPGQCPDFLAKARRLDAVGGHEKGVQHDFEVQLMDVPEEASHGVIAAAVMQQQKADLSGCHKRRHLHIIGLSVQSAETPELGDCTSLDCLHGCSPPRHKIWEYISMHPLELVKPF